jgi:hypothetical protein
MPPMNPRIRSRVDALARANGAHLISQGPPREAKRLDALDRSEAPIAWASFRCDALQSESDGSCAANGVFIFEECGP